MALNDENWIHDPSVNDDTVVDRALRNPEYARRVLSGRLLKDEHRLVVEGAAAAWEAAGGQSLKPEKAPRKRDAWVIFAAALTFLAVAVAASMYVLWPGHSRLELGDPVDAGQSIPDVSEVDPIPVTPLPEGVLRSGLASFVCQTDAARSNVECFGAFNDEALAPSVIDGDFARPVRAIAVGKGFGWPG